MEEFELYDDVAKLDQLVAKFDYIRDFTKLKCLDNILQYECDEMENKVLVFYYHPLTLNELRKKYPNAYIISREVPEDERFQIIEKFKKDPKEKVLIASIMMKYSFTLTECKAKFSMKKWSGIFMSNKRRISYWFTEEVYIIIGFNNFNYNIHSKP